MHYSLVGSPPVLYPIFANFLLCIYKSNIYEKIRQFKKITKEAIEIIFNPKNCVIIEKKLTFFRGG